MYHMQLLASWVLPDSCCCHCCCSWFSAQSSMTKVCAVHVPSTPAVVVVVPIPSNHPTIQPRQPSSCPFSSIYIHVYAYTAPSHTHLLSLKCAASPARASFNFRQTLESCPRSPAPRSTFLDCFFPTRFGFRSWSQVQSASSRSIALCCPGT